MTELAQQATLSDEDTAERRAILKKVGPIFLAVVDGGGNRDVLSEEPCVLGGRVGMPNMDVATTSIMEAQ